MWRWNAKRNVLAVMGSTDAGILSASNALLDPKRRSEVSGNLVFVNSEQLVAMDNQKTLARTVAVGSAAPAQPSAASAIQPSSPPTWVTSVVAVAIGGLLLIGAVIAFAVIGRRRHVTPPIGEDDSNQ